MTEVLASKDSGVPVTVCDAVLSRAARLSPDARSVLELVAVVPARTEMWGLDDTITPDGSTIEECVSAGMLHCDLQSIAFRHELARLAVEDSIPAARRRRLHNLVLKALLSRGDAAPLARIVHHAVQAGDSAAVLNHAPVAARQAAALNAHREAASHYRSALKYADGLAPQERARLLESLSFECYLTGEIDEALESRREALTLFKELGNELRHGDSLRWMSRLAWGFGRRAEAEDYAIEAVTVLENLTPSAELAMAYSNRAQLHMLAQEHEEVVCWGSRAIELAQKLNATETLAHALNNVGTAELFTNNDAGRLKLEESLRLALANNLHDDVGRAYTNLSFVTARNRRYDLAIRYLEDGIAYSTEHDLYYDLYMTATRARVHFDKGNWDLAADDAVFVLGHYQVPAGTRISALAVLGHVRVRRGDPDAARVLNEALERATQTGELQRIAPVASARAEFAWLKDDREKLLSEALPVMEVARRAGDPWIEEEFGFWLWRAGAAQETPQTITTPYALQSSGDWRAAAAAWKEIGCPYEEAMALADGDEPAQRVALEIFKKLGAGPAAERLSQTMRATGVRSIPRGPRPSTKENAAGLTNRQMDVLAFMTDGFANAEIAERLFISPKTVEHHVSAILAKLDAHTRGEAVSIALHSGLINQNRERQTPK